MAQVPSVKMNNGLLIPAIGLGCWSGTTVEEQEAGQTWMVAALKNGYRHLDTAYGYDTENVVGNAIRKSGIPREEVFVTTKLPSHHHGRVEESLDVSLKRFGFDYVDLYLMHWPQAFIWNSDDDPDPLTEDGNYAVVDHPNLNETWASMEKLLQTGKVKSIGISNFSVKTLTQLLKTAKIIPAVNQTEMHPHLAEKALVELAKAKGIVLTAYSPTGYAPVREDPAVVAIAKKYNASPAQISLAWHLSRGSVAIPKSTSSEHQLQNINLPSLDQEDIATLDTLDKGIHLCERPGPKARVYGWTYEQMGWSQPQNISPD
ncbi:Aldo/keto reductase [Ramaria rubella]|nr:Aldo/keto reductase [Ramaria rubella]